MKWLIRKLMSRIYSDIEHYRAIRASELFEAKLIADSTGSFDASLINYITAQDCLNAAQREAKLYNRLARFIGDPVIMAV